MKRCILVFILSVCAVGANAALYSRVGGEAYYDDVLHITWLTDANFALTSGYDSDGAMTWGESQAWVITLNTANHLGIDKWRLASVTDAGTPGCAEIAYNGTDCGYNVDISTGEMAHLFYYTLGNLAYYDTSGSPEQLGWGLTNSGPFTNLKSSAYWTGTEYVINSVNAWNFYFYRGSQYIADKDEVYSYALAVFDGDLLAPVPIPATFWLFGSALGLLGCMRRQAPWIT